MNYLYNAHQPQHSGRFTLLCERDVLNKKPIHTLYSTAYNR